MIRTRKATFYRGSDFIGSCEVGEYTKWGERHFPLSTAFVCPRCGHSWGQIRISFQDFHFHSRLCPDHGAGLLYPSDPWGVYRNFSRDLLKDFILTIPALR